MKFIKAYKYPLSITFALIAICFVFQNGTCGNTSVSSGSSTSNVTGVTTAALSISPTAATVAYGSTVYFVATGGTPPYTYLDLSGSYNINANTGAYTAPTSTSTVSTAVGVEVYDSSSPRQYVYATVNVGPTSGTTATPTATPNSNIGVISVSTTSQWPTNWSVQTLLTDNALSNDDYNCYSSNSYTSATPASPPSVLINLGVAGSGTVSAVNVDHINLRARLYTNPSYVSSFVSFPVSYRISAKTTGSSYTSLGTYTTQPDTDGVARVTLSATVSTSQLVITPIQMTHDTGTGYFLQLCGLSF